MDETQTEKSLREKSESQVGSESASDEGTSSTGMEVNLGDFTRTQGVLKSLRLLLNDQIVVPVEEVASGVSEAGRTFKMGSLEQANQDVSRLYAVFGRKIAQWESMARNLEHQMRMQAAKNPKSISIDKMNRMKSEQTAVRTRIRTAEVQFRRLHQGLNQAFTNLQTKLAAAEETTIPLPAGFLDRFKAASMADRPATVKQFFEIELDLKVHVRRGSEAYEIKFDPVPPLDRLYFFTKTAQVLLLQKLGKVVLFEDLESGAVREIKLSEFVKHVQHGAWLLKPRI